jgi:electron transfer flavoprotein alpha subunit
LHFFFFFSLFQVLVADDASLGHSLAETTAAVIVATVSKNNFTHVLAPSDSRGKAYIPRAAALLDVGALSDVISVVSEDTFVRPIYAGNALATVQSSDKVKMLTVRLTAFEKAPLSGSAPTEQVEIAPVKVIKIQNIWE